MLGYVNGPGVFLAGFGVVTERGYGVPGPPLVQPSTAGQNREKRGLSERSQIASSAAPVLTEERREVGAQRRPSRGGALFFAFFLLGKQKKEGRVRAAARFQNKSRAMARNNSKPSTNEAISHRQSATNHDTSSAALQSAQLKTD